MAKKKQNKDESITTLPVNASDTDQDQIAKQDPRSVAAGPGNQLQDNLPRPRDTIPAKKHLKHLPRNDSVDQADGSSDQSGSGPRA